MVEFNVSQSLGLDINRHIAIDAGAGTGKTTVMASRYLQHLLSAEQRATRILPSAPRIPLKGMGAIRVPSKERTDIEDWQGLLPTETVAITFTKKAAAELKGRIRRLIANLDSEKENRLRKQGDVAMLLSLVDDAPISTIDSFLSSIVSPWMGLVCEDPTSEQLEEDGAVFLRDEAIRTAWRLQRGLEGKEVGMSGDIEAFLESRDRLSVLLGGQDSSAKVVKGMLKRSLFVEEASRKLQLSADGSLQAESLDQLFLQPVADFIDGWFQSFRGHVLGWVDAWLDASAAFVTGADEPVGMTRFRYVQFLSTLEPEEQIEKIQWIWLVSHAVTTASNLKDINCKSLYRARPPKGNGWPAGIMTKGNCPLQNSVKDMISANAESYADSIRKMLHTPVGLLIRILGQSSHLLNPQISDPEPVPGQTAYPPRLGVDLPQTPPSLEMRLTTELELQVVRDLFIVNTGVGEILSRLKSQEGVRDHDDMHRLAEDLLLTRCPSVCREWYPKSVVDALDSLGEKPWQDGHLFRAISASQGNEDVHKDLMRRIGILRDLRRQYRAFIIDEYQDTNPQHFRLLARLWGRRRLEEGEPAPPASEWDPTICIVGDMKQSIYRFRQAEVTVMRRAVTAIREMNREELAMENRTDSLRRPDFAKDPRVVKSMSFNKGTEIKDKGQERREWIPFLEGDDGEDVSPESLIRRREGHIEMSTNHRTLPKLMNTMNVIFEDTFSERHHLLPGPWHAESQDLDPARDSERIAKLEWVLPARTGVGPRPLEMGKGIDPFQFDGSDDRELTANLLAKRIAALVGGKPARIYNSNDKSWIDVSEDKIYRPEDIMILVASHARVPLLVKALDEHGVPAIAGKQGMLMFRPTIQTLMSLLWLFISPYNKTAALAVTRSAIVGMNDSEVIAYFQTSDGNHLSNLAKYAPTDEVKSLFERLNYFVENGKVRKAIEVAIDNSDLLYAFPREGDRQDIENWISMYDRISESCGGDAALIFNQLRELSNLEKDGPKSSSSGTGGAVQIMTIHGSKGLEAPVVVAYDIFATGTRDSSFSSSDNVLVTPDIIAGRIHPWRGISKPKSGLWTVAHLFDDGQQRAERRRQFYVALTRARDRLIIAGTPSEGAVVDENERISFKRGKGRQNMGYMFLDGLAYASISSGNEGCAWSQGGLEQEGNTIALNPGELIGQSYLGDDCVEGISIFHHPDCFEQSENTALVESWKERLELAKSPVEIEDTRVVRKITCSVPMTSHGLDAAWSCRRRHWLTNKMNWNAERFDLIADESDAGRWPSAAEFGSLFHRLLEIGLANPGSTTTDLDAKWTESQSDNLTNSKTIEEVMAQSTISEEDVLERTKLRLLHLGKLARNGSLGSLVTGEKYDGFVVEGLRTELPFYLSLEHKPTGLQRTSWSPRGEFVTSEIEAIKSIFNGRADLVLALRDDEGQGWLQVVDAKTKQCLYGFNPSNPLEGNDLQISLDENSPYPTTEAEEEILQEHRLQLTLYSIALEVAEMAKPIEQRRKILPPAIQVSASGRMIRMRDEEFELAKRDLDSLIQWSGEVSVADEGKEAPQRLPVEQKSTCEKCPFYTGTIKLCGPIGEKLGPT
ncbi:MAG: UvrD-helicase domain-containing protein [Candidatus Thermoplasmatota archaeon]|nr:UvrD-helicase domain-containing protein [Candidatus Thermoplasmatota archaeon]